MPSVLFVCTANICRSPMAIAIWQSKVADDPSNWVIESAGTWALVGEPAAPYTQRVLANMGLDVGSHRARSVSRELLGQFNLILTMEKGQKEALHTEFPDFRDRVFLISEMINEYFDIHDPYRDPIIEYQATAGEIESILSQGYGRVIELSSP